MSARLERRYRRLMWAYPRHYRAGHGAEMVTTMLDLAEVGHAAPGVGQVLCGLRQRFRLPAGRPLVWVAAVLAAVVLGGFGSAAGTWLGWRTAASIPSDRELRALNVAMTGMPAPAAVYDLPVLGRPDAAVLADGTSDYSAERIRVALSAAGWHVTSLEQERSDPVTRIGTGARQITLTPTLVNIAYYEATKGSLKLIGSGTVSFSPAEPGVAGRAMFRMDIWPREPLVVRPLTVAGVVVGALVGWLLAAAGVYRVREQADASLAGWRWCCSRRASSPRLSRRISGTATPTR